MARVETIADNRQRLLDEGVRMLMEQGYHATGLKELLGRVEIPKGSFYNYYDSKEAFCCEAIRHYINPFIEKVRNCLAAPGVAPLTAIRNYFELLIKELESNDLSGGCLLGNLLGEVGDTSEDCRKTLAETVERYRDELKKGFVAAQEQGQARTDISAETMAILILDHWQGALLRMKVEKSTRPLKECCDQLLDNYFKA